MELFAVGLPGIVGYLALVHRMTPDAALRYFSTVAIAMLIASVLFQMSKVYTLDYVFARTLRFERVLIAWLAVGCSLIVIAFGLKISGFYSRIWVGTWFVSTTFFLFTGRAIFSRWARRWSEAGRFADRTVIVGAGEQGQRLAAHLKAGGDYQTRVVGFVDDRKTRLFRGADRSKLLGDSHDLIQYIRDGLVDQVFIALPWSAEDRVKGLVHSLAMTPVRIHLAPDLAGFEFPDRAYERVAGISMLRLFDRPISGWSHVLKTLEGRILGALFTLFLAPLMALIAVAIKLDSQGPVLFKQRRLGFNNAQFEVWKFRTMYADRTDADCDVQTTKNDPRVTRVGWYLRKWSLDELPQFINVLLGHMSIVGPRPHALGTKAEGHLFENVVDRYAARHKVKPGITGWAQVNGWRGETDTIEKIRRRVEYDLFYIDNWSLWFDLKIILKTAFVMLWDDNAY
ncbi:MAG: undecaprenyl-phosphate glucose phosphotransferase [Rhodospirillales bacterium]|nr:undecaprenyl-phosphate glucose phosphotransferase [Rhodospirillales bacterium]